MIDSSTKRDFWIMTVSAAVTAIAASIVLRCL
jgi:hypothetical protein